MKNMKFQLQKMVHGLMMSGGYVSPLPKTRACAGIKEVFQSCQLMFKSQRFPKTHAANRASMMRLVTFCLYINYANPYPPSL